MKKIKLSDRLELSQVVMGCMRIADAGITEQELLTLVETCLDMGVTSIDHAPVYGGYTCEKIFGDAVLRKRPELREKMQLITKAGIVCPGHYGNKTIYYNSTREEILREMDESLEKLGTDHVDLLLIHRPDPLADPAETADALETVVKQGKALHVGVSNFMPSQMTMLQSYLNIPLVTNQVELSVKNTENFFNGVVDDAFTRRIPLMAWSPLGGGDVFRSQEEKYVRLRGVLTEIAKGHETSMDAVMYAWLFMHPVRIAALTGTMNVDRIKAAAEAADLKLSYDEWYQILEASRGFSVP
ncbi:MAG TPA: aldo/keto reductase [Candidatus Blautia excrementigallinarum]|nr:aldo/keto reductase [Candidatus Blautia excrementigallinarum]